MAGTFLFKQTCSALPWKRTGNSSGDMASCQLKAVPLPPLPPWECPSDSLLSFWTEPAGKEIAQTIRVIYLCFNMPYKAIFFQN